MSDLKFAVLGAGAMGSVFGARLAKGGAHVTLLDVNQAHLDEIKASGLTVDLDDGQHIINIPAMRPEQYEDTPDIVLLFTKVFHTDAALKSVSNVLKHAVVLSLQNGIGNAERIASHTAKERTLLGVTLTPAEFLAPGHVASHGEASTQFGGLPDNTEIDLEPIKEALRTSGIDAEINNNIQSVIWEKAAFNCAMNAVCALTNGTPGSIGENDAARTLASDVVKEVVSVAAASGIQINREKIEALMSHAYAHHLMHEPSMLQDIKSARPTEIAALNGAMAQRGAELAVPTPINQTLAQLVSLAESTHAFRKSHS